MAPAKFAVTPRQRLDASPMSANLRVIAVTEPGPWLAKLGDCSLNAMDEVRFIVNGSHLWRRGGVLTSSMGLQQGTQTAFGAWLAFAGGSRSVS